MAPARTCRLSSDRSDAPLFPYIRTRTREIFAPNYNISFPARYRNTCQSALGLLPSNRTLLLLCLHARRTITTYTHLADAPTRLSRESILRLCCHLSRSECAHLYEMFPKYIQGVRQLPPHLSRADRERVKLNMLSICSREVGR